MRIGAGLEGGLWGLGLEIVLGLLIILGGACLCGIGLLLAGAGFDTIGAGLLLTGACLDTAGFLAGAALDTTGFLAGADGFGAGFGLGADTLRAGAAVGRVGFGGAGLPFAGAAAAIVTAYARTRVIAEIYLMCFLANMITLLSQTKVLCVAYYINNNPEMAISQVIFSFMLNIFYVAMSSYINTVFLRAYNKAESIVISYFDKIVCYFLQR